MSESTARASFAIGERVADREPPDGTADTAIVVNCPPQPADEWAAYGDTTVAEDNPDHPDDTPVVVVVYRSDLEHFDPEWAEREKPYPLTEFNEAGVSYYSFPATRLERLSEKDTVTEDTAETDTEIESEAGADSDSDAPRMALITDENTTTNTLSTAPTETDPSDTEPLTERGSDSDPELNPPTDAALQLKERLETGGMTVSIEADGRTLVAEKFGETYRIQPGGTVLNGDGLFASKLASIAAEYESEISNEGEPQAESGSQVE